MKALFNAEARRLLAPYRGAATRLTLLGVVLSLVELMMLGIFYLSVQIAASGRAVIPIGDWTLPSGPQTLLAAALLLGLVGILRFGLGLILERGVSHLGGAAVASLQTEAMKAHLTAPLSAFWRRKGGEMVFHINSLPIRAKEFVQSVPSLLSSLVMLAIISLFLVLLSWKLFLASLAVAFAYGVFLQGISHRVYHWASETLTRLGKELATKSHEALAGIRQIRVFHAESSWVNDFHQSASEHGRELSRHRFWSLLPQRSLDLVVILIFAAGLAWTGAFADKSALRTPELLAFVFGILRLIPPLVQAGRSYGQLTSALPSVTEFYGHLATFNEVERPAHRSSTKSVEAAAPRVDLRDVHFGYAEGPEVIRGVTLVLEPGRVAALVGLSGAGKSTLLDLIMGLLKPDSGVLLADGEDVARMDPDQWLRRISLASQDPFLFHDTIEANLRVAFPEATPQQLFEACRLAGADEFLGELSAGIQTVVGDRGGRLSGGQRQRLALARAFLKPASLLVLDEPTSAVDAKMQGVIFERVWPLLKSRTTLLVTHHPDVIRKADWIYVLADGEIRGEGTHESLSSRSGLYRELVGNRQEEFPRAEVAPIQL